MGTRLILACDYFHPDLSGARAIGLQEKYSLPGAQGYAACLNKQGKRLADKGRFYMRVGIALAVGIVCILRRDFTERA